MAGLLGMCTAFRLCAMVEVVGAAGMASACSFLLWADMAVCMVLRVVIIDTWWKRLIQVLKWEKVSGEVGGSKSSRKAVGGSEVLAEDSENRELRT